MNGGTQLGVYESFEDIFGRKSTWEELIAEIRAFKQQSVLWVCATIAAGRQLWTRLDLQPEEVYRQPQVVFRTGIAGAPASRLLVDRSETGALSPSADFVDCEARNPSLFGRGH